MAASINGAPLRHFSISTEDGFEPSKSNSHAKARRRKLDCFPLRSFAFSLRPLGLKKVGPKGPLD